MDGFAAAIPLRFFPGHYEKKIKHFSSAKCNTHK